jgi:hypothetical protein
MTRRGVFPGKSGRTRKLGHEVNGRYAPPSWGAIGGVQYYSPPWSSKAWLTGGFDAVVQDPGGEAGFVVVLGCLAGKEVKSHVSAGLPPDPCGNTGPVESRVDTKRRPGYFVGMVRLSGVMVSILGLALAGAGCRPAPLPAQEQEIWAGVKLGDLAPPANDRPPPPQVLGTVNVEIHTMILPAENVERLDNLWQLLSPGTIRMNSYNAFSANSFRVKSGRAEIWDQIRGVLAEADGQQAATTSLVVPDNDTTDLLIANLPIGRAIGFVGNDLSRQSVNVGPGMLVLRLRAEAIPWGRGVRKIIAYPTYTLPVPGTIPALQAGARRQEFYFAPAAFALQMAPGDFVVLGPDEYTAEQRTLGGLFFNHLRGALFFNPSKRTAPVQKPAVRVYILVCTGING